MRSWLPIVLAAASCGEPVALAPAAKADVAVAPGAAAQPTATLGDALLSSARTRIAGGVLDGGVASALAASKEPLHVRATALLDAIDRDRPRPRAAPSEALSPSPAIAAEAPIAAPPVAAPPVAAPAVSASEAAAPAARAPTTLEKLSLRGSASDATLTIDAGRGMVVGIAAQPGAGLVRLVIKDVRASAAVLAARPKAGGARVVDVDAGPSSVRITLEIDDGWRVVGTKRTSKGAVVQLSAS